MKRSSEFLIRFVCHESLRDRQVAWLRALISALGEHHELITLVADEHTPPGLVKLLSEGDRASHCYLPHPDDNWADKYMVENCRAAIVFGHDESKGAARLSDAECLVADNRMRQRGAIRPILLVDWPPAARAAFCGDVGLPQHTAQWPETPWLLYYNTVGALPTPKQFETIAHWLVTGKLVESPYETTETEERTDHYNETRSDCS